MADLHNLLDEVDDALHQEEEADVATLDADATQDAEDWDDEDREELDLPAALEEIEQKKMNQDDVYAEDEEDVGIEEDGNQKVQEAQCYSELKRLWQQELACPELLPMDETVLQEITEELEQREQAIADLSEQSGDMEALLGSVLKVDADRARFMLSDLLRTRLWKIQEHPIHMVDLAKREIETGMTDSERQFLRGYGRLLEGHLRSTVLDHMKVSKTEQKFRMLDMPEMIDRPDLDQYVFVKVKETSEINSGTEDEPFVQQHEAGATLITRYSVVRGLLVDEKVELVL